MNGVRSAVRSLTFSRPSDSAVSAVTTNEFESIAVDGVSATRPFGSSWVCSRATVSAASAVASPALPFKDSNADAAYSAVKLMSPLRSELKTMSR